MLQKVCLKLSTSVCCTNIRHFDLWLTPLKWQKIEMLGMLGVKNLKMLSSEEVNILSCAREVGSPVNPRSFGRTRPPGSFMYHNYNSRYEPQKLTYPNLP